MTFFNIYAFHIEIHFNDRINYSVLLEQVLVVKDETQKQYEVLQTRYSELESNFEKQLKERLEEKQREKKDSETMYDIELTEVGTECEQNNAGMDNIDFMRELEDRDNELELVNTFILTFE